jgi:N-acetylglucosaminyldiphosphoundecaprenol N-acetyl-beta-D-mannosaminyltransferase
MQYEINEISICGDAKESIFKEVTKLLENNFPSLVVTFNLDFLRISEENDKFNDVCQKADLIVADGVGVTTLIKLKYGVKIERITGNELFSYLLELSKLRTIRYAFVGSSENALSGLKTRIQNEFPNIKNMFFYSPPYLFEKSSEETNLLIEQLKQFKPDILFLALGCPRQEIWLYENMNTVGAKINIGVGAVFDFYSGFKRRAPLLIQKIGLEWFWRLLMEPKRLFGRYVLRDIPCWIKNAIKRRL